MPMDSTDVSIDLMCEDPQSQAEGQGPRGAEHKGEAQSYIG